MKEYFKKMLASSDDVSMMRLLSAFVVLDIMIAWNIMCFKKGEFLDIGANAVALIAGTLLGKALQKFAEKKGADQ